MARNNLSSNTASRHIQWEKVKTTQSSDFWERELASEEFFKKTFNLRDPASINYKTNAVNYKTNAVNYKTNAVNYGTNAVNYGTNAVNYGTNAMRSSGGMTTEATVRGTQRGNLTNYTEATMPRGVGFKTQARKLKGAGLGPISGKSQLKYQYMSGLEPWEKRLFNERAAGKEFIRGVTSGKVGFGSMGGGMSLGGYTVSPGFKLPLKQLQNVEKPLANRAFSAISKFVGRNAFSIAGGVVMAGTALGAYGLYKAGSYLASNVSYTPTNSQMYAAARSY